MVKITSSCRNKGHVIGKMIYDARSNEKDKSKHLELEDENGNKIKSTEEIKDLADEWAVDFVPEKYKKNMSIKIPLEIPGYTIEKDPEKQKKLYYDFKQKLTVMVGKEFGDYEARYDKGRGLSNTDILTLTLSDENLKHNIIEVTNIVTSELDVNL